MSKNLLHTPEGVRDVYGKEYAAKLEVESRIRRVINSYGYQDIQTPVFEFLDVFGSEIGTTPVKELYQFFDKEGNTLALRPDFTPSVARCAAKYYMDETLPVRLTYAGNTFTNSSSLQGKLKEVTQMGAELMMDPSVEADAEMISLVISVLQGCGLKEFQVSIGEAEYFKGVCAQAGLEEETEERLRQMISAKNYFGTRELLEEKKVRQEYAGVLLQMADMLQDTAGLQEAGKQVSNERSLQAVERLEALYEVLCRYGVEKYVTFDLGLLSKYHYYTGVMFKAYTYGLGDAIVNGGRYDNLLEQFGKPAPAIGFMVVVDDLLEALARQHLSPQTGERGVLLVYEKGAYPRALEQAMALRRQGTPAELMPAMPGKTRNDYETAARLRRQSSVVYLEE